MLKRKKIRMWARGRKDRAQRPLMAAAHAMVQCCTDEYKVLGEGWGAVVGSGGGSQKASKESVALPLPGNVWYLLSEPTSPREVGAVSPLKVASSGSLTYDRSSTYRQSLRRSNLPSIMPPPSPSPQWGKLQGPPCSPWSPRSHTAPAPGLASSHPTAA